MPVPGTVADDIPNRHIIEELGKLAPEQRTEKMEPQFTPIDKEADGRPNLGPNFGGEAEEPAEGQLSPEFLAAIAEQMPPREAPAAERVQQPAEAEQKVDQVKIPSTLLLAIVEHGVAGQEAFLQELGVGLGALIDWHINRSVMLIASIDNPIVRGQIIENLVTRLPAEIDNAYLRRHQTKAGLIVPPPGTQS